MKRMTKHILILQGHPDPKGDHFGNALARAYADGAKKGGHETREIAVARLDFPLLRTQEDFSSGTPVASIREAQQNIRWADHILILFPLWLGTMPALLKGFFEQAFRPNFAMTEPEKGRWPKGALHGKSAHVVVTMGMPAPVFRWYFRAHGVKSLEQNILRFSGIKPIRETLIGMVEATGNSGREKWLERMRAFGRAAK